MNKTIIVLMATLGLTALTGAGATPDLFDNFDGYSLGRTFTTTVNGWQTSAGGVMVTNDTAHSGTQSVTLPVGTDLTNLVSGGSGKVIWTDFFMKPAMGDTPPEFSTDGASLCLYFGTNGYAALVTAAGEQVLSNDVWGTALAPATTNFVRLTVYQNYATSKQAVLIDGRLVAQDLPFVTPVATYDTLRLLNGSTNAWVDDVWVKTTYDTATLTNDANTNGMSDAAELALYGYAARTLYVGVGSGQPQYPTFQTAISAWRPHDALYVYAGNYTNDVLATNSLTFSGNAFTNTGTLTVSANASVTFPSAMTWGNVTVDTNSTAVFGAALTCSNLVVATGATATFYAVTCSNVFVASGAHATFLGTLVCAGTCTLDTGATAGFSNTVVCAGAVTIGNNAAVACGQSLTCGALAVSAGATGTFQAVTCASVFVATGAHVTGLGALACTGACTLDLGAAASFSNTVVCAGNLTVGTNATFTAGQSVTCSNLYAWTGATGTFQAVTCTNLTAQTGVHLTAAGAVSSATDCTLGSGDVATFGGTLGCGGNLTVGTNDLVTVAQGLTCGNLYISANATGTFHAVTCASLVTEAGVHLTFLNTLLCAADCTIGANASVGFSNTVTCASLAIQAGAQVAFQGAFLCTGNSSIVAATVAFNGAVSCGGVWLVDANANVTFGQSAALATLNVNGTLMLAGGGALSANSVTVTGLVQVAVAGTVNVTNLTVTGGGQLQFTNGQFVVTGAGVNMAGTFTINNTWGQAAAVPLPDSNSTRQGHGSWISDSAVGAPGTPTWWCRAWWLTGVPGPRACRTMPLSPTGLSAAPRISGPISICARNPDWAGPTCPRTASVSSPTLTRTVGWKWRRQRVGSCAPICTITTVYRNP